MTTVRSSHDPGGKQRGSWAYAANLGDLSFLHGLLDLPASSFSESACAFPPSDIEWL
jgi:hypothetical protein